jgi:hypothetical protein
MNIFKIDKTTFQSDGLIEGWTSAIWTERHKELGDFQIKTPYVEETIAKIPIGSLISHQDTSEVCRVESMATTISDKGAVELTVTGRSLESFLEKRVLTGPWNEPWTTPGTYTVQDMIAMYIWNSIVNPHNYEVIRDYHWDHLAREVIPNVLVTLSIKVLKNPPIPGVTEDLVTTKEWGFDRGALYPKVQEMLTLGNLGIRIIRPVSTNAIPGDTTGTVAKILSDVTFPNDTAARTLAKSDFSPTDKLRFDIYNGRNRSVTSATDTPLDINPPVIFSTVRDDITLPTYLFSLKDSFTSIHMQAPDASVEIYAGEVGLDYTMEWLSIDNIDDTLVGADYNQFIIDKAWAEWKNKKVVRLIDGAVSSETPYQYGTDYYLGDTVTVLGDYGVVGKKMVSEFIRSSDSSGEKAYPTLIDPP